MKEKRRHVTKNKIRLFLMLVAVMTMLFSPTVLADNDENRNVPKEEKKKKKYDLDEIESTSSGILDSILISGMVNSVKNEFGKPMVVIIKSQMGAPIYAFSGSKVYWEVEEDLPRFTKLMIDNKALYIHRANFQIIDKALLD